MSGFVDTDSLANPPPAVGLPDCVSESPHLGSVGWSSDRTTDTHGSAASTLNWENK